MNLKKLKDNVDNFKGLIISITGVLGLSFVLHGWMSTNFVTTVHFDNSVKNIENKIDKEVARKMDEQFLVLRKNIKETEYNVLGGHLAGINIKDKFSLTPFEIDNITKMVRKHCMIGKELGYMPNSTDCEKKVESKLNGGL